MGKILVTGASGNVGSYVAQKAIELKQQITVAGTNIDRLNEMFQGTATVVYFDFTKIETFEKALVDVDRVYLMRPPHLGNPEDLKPFIDELAKRDIKLVCFLSLIGIEHNPVPPHYKIEKFIEKTGLPYCHIRPSFFMQNISGIHSFEIKQFNRIVVPVKKAMTSFIDAEDIGELIATVLSNPSIHQNKGYSITGSEALDYYQVEDILSKELNREIIYANPSPRSAKNYWINIRGLDKTYSKVMSMLYMMTRLGTAKKTTNTFMEIMGKEPQTFEQFAHKNRKAWEL